MTDPWMDRLSEYLDGDLAPAERAALEAHLVDCASCRATTEDLRRLVARTRTLVDRPVRGELWSGIAARIGTAGAPIIDLPARRARRTLSLNFTQLAAAAVLLLAVGAGVSAVALRAPAGTTPPALTAAPPALRALPVGLPTKAEQSYETAVQELEQALNAGRGTLSPKTVAVLERNLDRIDVAIAEARTALQSDPANAYLSAHLAGALQQKLMLLQQATLLVAPAS